MKKESFLRLLCITASIVVAIGFIAFMFKALHWPVGDLLSTIVTPILLVIQSILMLCYVPKYGALKGNGNCVAKHLLHTEISALVFVILFAIGLLFRGLLFPGAAIMIMISCIALCLISLIAGFLGCKLINKK
ncbi:MAG: hypothetical protein IKV22_00690 [Paludibacteraceae bacterium]|nr:hypothetical protein [Paludibacteraceae bacterium]